jgi:hypothetical protein
MTQGRFSVWRREGLARGQRRLADTVRLLIYKADPDLFDFLDYEDDDSFLDPLLFACFTDPAPALKLPQLLAARILPRIHPARISVRTDADGRVVLPGLGELETGLPRATIEIGWDALSGEPRGHNGGDNVPTHFRRPLHIAGTNIEVISHRQPLLDRFFVEAGGSPDTIELTAATHRHLVHVVSAFNLLRGYCPDLADEILAGTRLVVLFQAEQPNSFATLSAHGAIFLNVNGAIDEVYFLEDIAHQTGHVLFNALTLAKDRFLLINPDTPLDRESRTVYSAFHALFTYVTIGQALAALWERRVFDARQAHEALGRLGLVLRKFAYDLALLDRAEFWTPLGRRCWRHFESIFAELQARYAPLTQGFDYSNQPYNFDYRLFAELNPPVLSVPLRRTA